MKKILRNISAVLISFFLCGCSLFVTDLTETTEQETEESDQTVNGFEPAVYERFDSTASENGLEGTPVYLTGKVIGEGVYEDTIAITIEQESGDKWLVILPTYSGDETPEKIDEKEITVYGTYFGFSDAYNLPAIALVSDDEDFVYDICICIDGYKIWRFTDYVEAVSTETSSEIQESLSDYQDEEPFFSYAGNGDDVIQNVYVESTAYAYVENYGERNFVVKSHYGDNESDLLINTIGPYNGTVLLLPVGSYTFEVNSSGDWKMDLYNLGTSSTDSFSGSGDFVSPIFVRTSDVYEISSFGSGHFAVKGWGNNGYELLVNTTEDNYSGKVLFDTDEKYAFFEITSEREWSINPVK